MVILQYISILPAKDRTPNEVFSMATPKSSSIKTFFSCLSSFFTSGIWTDDLGESKVLPRSCKALCRILTITVQGYMQDRCNLQSCALTYITLVSLVPMAAIMFSFSKGIGMHNRLVSIIGLERIIVQDAETGEDSVSYRVVQPLPEEPPATAKQSEVIDTKGVTEETPVQEPPPQEAQETTAKDDDRIAATAPTPAAEEGGGFAATLPPPLQAALVNIFIYVEHTNFAALGLVGSLTLLIGVISSMTKLENTFNSIWRVKRGRDYLHKVSEYLVVLILIPVVLISATSMNAFVRSHRFFQLALEVMGGWAYLLQLGIRMVGWGMVFLGFAFFYMFMPHTKVRLCPALTAGLITGILWFIMQWLYIRMQVGLAGYNKIYGTFAALPFFLAWLYANWCVILLGAELCYAVQNHTTIRLARIIAKHSQGARILLGIAIIHDICRAYRDGTPWRVETFAQRNNISLTLLQHVIDTLCHNHVLLAVQIKKREPNYVPGKDPRDLSLADVMEAFQNQKDNSLQQYLRLIPTQTGHSFMECYDDFCSTLKQHTFAEAGTP